MSNLEATLLENSALVYEEMDSLLPSKDEADSRLVEAMRYSALGNGKRIRPFLTISTSNIFGVSKESAIRVAAAIEFIHTYSLIHDDLPAMDDDDFRRGQPSCHKKFDEATAILAGDALLTLAFEVITSPDTRISNSVRCELVNAVAKAAGAKGMVGGQMMDIRFGQEEIPLNKIIHLQRLKTGEMFAISCEAGAILGNAPKNLRAILKAYAYDIGLVFQITDDLLDVDSNVSEKRNNKTEGRATLVHNIGPQKSREQIRLLASQSVRHLEVFGKNANILKELTYYIIDRKT